MAPGCRVDRGRVFLPIFARNLIPLAYLAEAPPLRQPNKRVQRAPRQYRAKLQTAATVPSLHLITLDADLITARRPVSDAGETRCCGERRRDSLGHRGHQKAALSSSGIIILHASARQSASAIDHAVSAYLANCAQIADSELARFGQLGPTCLLRAQNSTQKKQRPPGWVKPLQEAD